MTLIPPRMHRIGHFTSYGLLAFLCVLALPPALPSLSSRVVAGFLIATGFGISMEFLQRLHPGRSPSLVDALVNAGAAALGAQHSRARQDLR